MGVKCWSTSLSATVTVNLVEETPLTSTGSRWDELPEDILRAIFRHPSCTKTSMLAARLVCQTWFCAVNSTITKLKVDLSSGKAKPQRWTLAKILGLLRKVSYLLSSAEEPSGSASTASRDAGGNSRLSRHSSGSLSPGCSGSWASCGTDTGPGVASLQARQLQNFPSLSKLVLTYGWRSTTIRLSQQQEEEQLQALANYAATTESHLHRVSHLQLVGWQIHSLPPALMCLTRLTSLDVSGCQLGTYDCGLLPPCLSTLQGLRCLNVKACKLRALGCLTALTGLKVLDASHNGILGVVSSVALAWKSMKELDLSHNSIMSVPKALADLPRLKRLQLSHQDICTPWGSLDVFSRLRSCHELRVKSVPLSGSLPSVSMSFVHALAHLRRLELKNNTCTPHELPSFFSRLVQLERFKYSGNKLTCLPGYTLAKMKALKILELPRNSLEHLPEDIGGLASLEVLNLSLNSLAALPSSMSRLSSLRKLSLKVNNLPCMQPAEVLAGLLCLEFLDVRHNEHLTPCFQKVALLHNGHGALINIVTQEAAQTVTEQ